MNRSDPTTPPSPPISGHGAASILADAIIEAYSSLTREQYESARLAISLVCDFRTAEGQLKGAEMFDDAVAYYVHGERR